MSVTICLEDEIDVSRGDMLVPAARPPESNHRFENHAGLDGCETSAPAPAIHSQAHHADVQARVREVRHRVDINSLENHQAAELG